MLRRNGQHWGSMQLTREHTDRDYGDDAAFVRDVAPLLVDGLRRSLVATPPAAAADSALGVLLLDAGRRLVASTPAAERWLARLDGRSVPAGLPGPTRPLPFPVTVVAHAQGRRALTSHTRVRAPDGTWAVVSAAPLSGSPPGTIAITVQCASPTAVLPLLEAAYGLTRRERQVSRLVLEGLGTTKIARRLAIGDYTVQDHLKAVFAKVGVRSRTALAAAFLLPAPAPPPTSSTVA